MPSWCTNGTSLPLWICHPDDSERGLRCTHTGNPSKCIIASSMHVLFFEDTWHRLRRLTTFQYFRVPTASIDGNVKFSICSSPTCNRPVQMSHLQSASVLQTGLSSTSLRKTRLLLRTLELNQIANDIRLQSINPLLLCTSYHSIPYQNNKGLRSVRAEWITDDTNSESDSAERGERVCVCVWVRKKIRKTI